MAENCAVDLAALWVTICNAVQSDGPQLLDFEYKWNWVLYVLVLQQLLAHSAHFHRVTRSGERIGRGLHASRPGVRNRELVLSLLVVYEQLAW